MFQLKEHLFSRHLLAFLTLSSFILTGITKFLRDELSFAFWIQSFVLFSLIGVIIFVYFWLSQTDWVKRAFDSHLDKLKNREFDFKFVLGGLVYFLVIFYFSSPSPALLNPPFSKELLILWTSFPLPLGNLFSDNLASFQKFLFFLLSCLVFLGLYFLAKDFWFKKEQKLKYLSSKPDWTQKIVGLGSFLAFYLLTKIPLVFTYLSDFYENFIWSQRNSLNFRISTQILHRQLLNPYKFDPLFKLTTLVLFGLVLLLLLGLLLLTLKKTILFLNRVFYVDLANGDICLFTLGRGLLFVDKSFLYSLFLLLVVFSPYWGYTLFRVTP